MVNGGQLNQNQGKLLATDKAPMDSKVGTEKDLEARLYAYGGGLSNKHAKNNLSSSKADRYH
jgi:hypothetical protein